MALIKNAFSVTGGDEDRPLERDALLRGVAGAEVIVCLLTETIDGAVMDAAGPSLRVISNMAVGVDNIDVAAATARGILVTNTPGVLTDATADLAWALILSTVRRVVEGDAMVREGRFERWSPFMLLGRSVAGATLGIVGMGRIGQAVARRALGWDMKVVYTRRSGALEAAAVPAGADWQYRASLDDLLREADIVSLHVPLTPDTRHLIGARELALMKPGSYLVNTARGPVVDEAALVEALRSGHLGGAGLDVYEREPELAPGLAAAPNATLLPHLGSATVETRGRMAELAALNAIAAVSGGAGAAPREPGSPGRMAGGSALRGGRHEGGTHLMRRRSLWLLLVMALLAAVLALWVTACSSGDGGDGDTTTTEAGDEPSGDIEGTVGATLKVGKAVITVRVLDATFNPVVPEQRMSEQTPSAPSGDESFYQAYVKIENKGAMPIRVDPEDFACAVGSTRGGHRADVVGPHRPEPSQEQLARPAGDLQGEGRLRAGAALQPVVV